MADRVAEWIRKGDNDKLKTALEAIGENVVRCKTQDGTPLLNIAIDNHNITAARLLMDKKVDLLLTDQRGRTVLHTAAEVDNVIIDLFKTCAVNVQDENGDTPLHLAVKSTSVEMVKWLVFIGADPSIPNRAGKPCQILTQKNLIRQILRDFNNNSAPLRFATLSSSSLYRSKVLPFSIKLTASSSATTDFVYKWSSLISLPSGKVGAIKEEDEIWGPIVEYRTTRADVVDMTFPLHDIPDSMHELVFRLHDTDSGGVRDVLLDVVEENPPNLPADPEDDIIYVGYADVRAQLNEGGLLMLLCRPVHQPVLLKKGATTVKAQVDERVLLSIPENAMESFTGELQLERSMPVKEPVALVRAPPQRMDSCVFESQTDYVKLYTPGQRDPGATDLTIELPVPIDYSGGTLNVYVRTVSVDAHRVPRASVDSGPVGLEVSRSVSQDAGQPGRTASFAKRNSLASLDSAQSEVDARSRVTTDKVNRSRYNSVASTSSDLSGNESASDIEDEIEARKWTKGVTVSVKPNNTSIQVPVVTNKTITVVETKKKVPEDKLKEKLAKQFRKRRYKKALFFVAGRAWAGWRECQEIIVVVTSPSHLSKELGRHLTDGYCLLSVSGEFRVPAYTDFRLCVVGGLFVEHGEDKAVITFQHVMRKEQAKNHYAFVLRKKNEQATQGRFVVFQKKKQKKADKSDGQSSWKNKGEIHFDLSGIGQERRFDQQKQQELTEHFSDHLLLDLAEKVLPSEAAILGIRLGLTHVQVDNVMSNASIFSPVFKCFELLRRQRDRSESAVQFGKTLVQSLRGMEWNQQCEWLLKQLQGLPGLKGLESGEPP